MSPATVEPIAVIPSGFAALDVALGIGGYPRGRVIEVFGPNAEAVSRICGAAIVEAQRQGKVVALVDGEHRSPIRGVDLAALLVAQPDEAEQALGIVEQFARSGVASLIVLDSIASYTATEDYHGLHARLMSRALRTLTAIASRTYTTVLIANQIRQKIGVTFGNGEVSTGGNALKYYSSVRLDVRVIEGDRVQIRVVKNKYAPPFQTVEVAL